MTEIKNVLNSSDLREKLEKLNAILNQPPKPEWIQDHKFATKKVNGKEEPVQFIPIGIVEDALRDIFGMFTVRINSVQHIHNSVSMSVTLRILSPLYDGPDHAWIETDGIGGYPIFDGSYGVQMALPAAKSFAVKDAAETLGKIFGSDINRQLDPEVVEISNEVTPEIFKEIAGTKTISGIKEVYEKYPHLHSNPIFTDALKDQRLFLKK